MLKNIATLSLLAVATFSSNHLVSGEGLRSVSKAETKPSGNGISAVITFQKRWDGKGLDVSVNAQGLKAGMPYPYHIHNKPVPADGNCTATDGHFDPYHINKDPKSYHCDPENAAKTCEAGDLSGRHGNMTAGDSGEYTTAYTDELISFSGKNSILGHSVVIHAADNSRLACANIVAVAYA